MSRKGKGYQIGRSNTGQNDCANQGERAFEILEELE